MSDFYDTSKPVIIKGFVLIFILGAIIVGYTFQLTHFANTFEVRYLVFRAAFMGIFIGWLAHRFSKKEADVDMVDRVRNLLIYSFLGGVALPVLALYTNRAWASNAHLNNEKVIFLKETPLKTNRFGISKDGAMKADAYYTYFIRKDKEERIRSRYPLFKNVESGTEIEIPIQKGFWGFEFVKL